MLSPHKNSLEKFVDANVSIHEKRKTLQKAQVGDEIKGGTRLQSRQDE